MSNKNKCPHLGRLVSSYRFFGFNCHVDFLVNGYRMGDIQEWTKEERAKNMEHYGCYNKGEGCPFINRSVPRE